MLLLGLFGVRLSEGAGSYPQPWPTVYVIPAILVYLSHLDRVEDDLGSRFAKRLPGTSHQFMSEGQFCDNGAWQNNVIPEMHEDRSEKFGVAGVWISYRPNDREGSRVALQRVELAVGHMAAAP